MTYIDALQHAWLTDSEVAFFFQVTLQTAKRWKRLNAAPVGVIQALRLIAGDCPALSNKSQWEGWAFSGGYLWSPELDKFRPGDIKASKLDRDIIKGYEQETAKLREQLKGQPLPVKNSNIIPFPTVNRFALRSSKKRDSEIA